MQNFVEIIQNNFSNTIALLFISMLPLVELKGAIPIGFVMNVSPLKNYIISYVGSTLPSIFILMRIMPIFDWLKKKDKLKAMVSWAKDRANNKKEKIENYKYWGLFFFVAIPLPGAGVRMGSLIASLFGLKKLKSFAMIALGNALAGVIIHSFSNIIF